MRRENESNAGVGEAEETLREVARLAPPDGLEERVHRRLALEPARRGFWRLWRPAQRLEFAGAAVLAVAIAASALIARHPRTHAPAAQPVPQQGGGFGSAGAERHPASLAPIVVPERPVSRKKPSAGHARKTARSRTQAGAAAPGSTIQNSTGQGSPGQGSTTTGTAAVTPDPR